MIRPNFVIWLNNIMWLCSLHLRSIMKSMAINKFIHIRNGIAFNHRYWIANNEHIVWVSQVNCNRYRNVVTGTGNETFFQILHLIGFVSFWKETFIHIAWNSCDILKIRMKFRLASFWTNSTISIRISFTMRLLFNIWIIIAFYRIIPFASGCNVTY